MHPLSLKITQSFIWTQLNYCRVSNGLWLCMSDPGVQFISGLSDVNAIIGDPAEIICKLNSENCVGAWFRDGNKVSL